MTGRLGRRPGSTSSRGAIIEAARREFAERGYERATIRSIAAEAGVDPATIYHFFEGKDRLLAAALEFPVDEAVVSSVLPEGEEVSATALLRNLLTLWSDPEIAQRVMALLRVAATHPDAGAVVSGLFSASTLRPMVAGIDADAPEFRAGLVASQLAGLALLRLVVPFAPIAEATPEDLVAAVAPTIDRYLNGDLGEASS